MLSNGSIIDGNWKVQEKIGEGACAIVYSVTPCGSMDVEYPVVAKVIPLAKGKSKKDKDQERLCNTLNYEYMLYTGLLCGFPHGPRLPRKFYGDDRNLGVRYLIMERFDMDLTGLLRNGSVPTFQVLSDIGLQILDGLSWLHSKNFLFIDVKPENFLMSGDRVFFVDFGLVERFLGEVGAVTGSRAFAGTPTFCSLFVHKGNEPSGNDDVESLAFVLMSLLSGGKLQWSNAKSDSECLRLKESFDVVGYTKDMGCPELGQVITLCRQATATKKKVDKSTIKQLLLKLKDNKVSHGASSKSKPKTTHSQKPSSSSTPMVIDLSDSDDPKGKKMPPRTTPKENVLPQTGSAVKRKKNPSTEEPPIETPSEGILRRSTRSAGKTSGGPFSFGADGSSGVRRDHHATVLLDQPMPFKAQSLPTRGMGVAGSFSLTLERGVGGESKNKFQLVQPKEVVGKKVILKSIGRDLGCDISLNDDIYVSDNHCVVKISNEKNMFVQDSGSTNGTFLNEVKLPKRRWTELKIGDILRCGQTAFQAEY